MSNIQAYNPKARTGVTCPACGGMARVHRTMRCSGGSVEFVTRYFYCGVPPCKWRTKIVEIVGQKAKSA